MVHLCPGEISQSRDKEDGARQNKLKTRKKIGSICVMQVEPDVLHKHKATGFSFDERKNNGPLAQRKGGENPIFTLIISVGQRMSQHIISNLNGG